MHKFLAESFRPSSRFQGISLSEAHFHADFPKVRAKKNKEKSRILLCGNEMGISQKKCNKQDEPEARWQKLYYFAMKSMLWVEVKLFGSYLWLFRNFIKHR